MGKEGFPGGERTWKLPRGRGPGTHAPLLLWVFPLLCSISHGFELGHFSVLGVPPAPHGGHFVTPVLIVCSTVSWGAGLPRSQAQGDGFVLMLLLPGPSVAAALALDVGSEQRESVAGRWQRGRREGRPAERAQRTPGLGGDE